MDGQAQGVQSTDLILGQEFLTWLWFRSESDNSFKNAQGDDFIVSMEQRVVVQGGAGDLIETASVTGAHSELREARLGLTTGKKVTRAQIRLESGPESWQLGLKAEDFSLSSFKTPKVEKTEGEKEDEEAAFFEKVYLMERGLGFVDAMFSAFLKVRAGAAWKEEVKKVQTWLYPD